MPNERAFSEKTARGANEAIGEIDELRLQHRRKHDDGDRGKHKEPGRDQAGRRHPAQAEPLDAAHQRIEEVGDRQPGDEWRQYRVEHDQRDGQSGQ